MRLPHSSNGRTYVVLAVLGSALAEYQWPSPQYEALEELLYEGTDLTGLPIASLALDCQSRLFDGGPPFGAEWLRLAYHDMSTHNVTDGTGGLDASILYELDRPENIGEGNLDSLEDFQRSTSKYVSLADIIAMGAVWGVAGCDGPIIPYRGGRIDAQQAGLPGVPEPQQDLQTHTEKFRLQGFTPQEMIQIVACGHTIGGVRKADFPDIVKSNDPNNLKSVDAFDSTQIYDNVIVAEYLNGTTKNPLIVTSNTTLQSDRRIFSSDGNVTINSIASPSAFFETCAAIFERMLNTVPKGVTLTEEIQIIPFKLKSAYITIIGSQLVLKAIARIQMPATSGTFILPATSPTAKLFWCDRRGEGTNCSNNVVNFATPAFDPDFDNGNSPLMVKLGSTFVTYTFIAPISSNSAGSFWFTVTEDGKAPMLQDNGGKQYNIIQDALINVPQLYKTLNQNSNIGDQADEQQTRAVVALNTSSTPILALMRTIDNTLQTNISPTRKTYPPPRNFTTTLELASDIPPVAGYTFYSAIVKGFSAQADFTVEVDGSRYLYDPGVIASNGFFSASGPDSGSKSLSFSSVGKMSLSDALSGVETTNGTTPGSNTTTKSAASSDKRQYVLRSMVGVIIFSFGMYLI